MCIRDRYYIGLFGRAHGVFILPALRDFKGSVGGLCVNVTSDLVGVVDYSSRLVNNIVYNSRINGVPLGQGCSNVVDVYKRQI